MLDNDKELGIMELFPEIRIAQLKNTYLSTEKELRSLLLEALQKRNPHRALELGKRLEELHARDKNEKMIHATQLLVTFIKDLLRWPLQVLRESRYTVMERLSYWFIDKNYNYSPDTFRKSKKGAITLLLSLEEGVKYRLNENDLQIFAEISHNGDKLRNLKNHLFIKEEELKSFFQYIPEFTLDESSNTIEIQKSPFFNLLDPFERLLLRLYHRNLIVDDQPPSTLTQASPELHALEGIFHDVREEKEELYLTEQGVKYVENVVEFYFRKMTFRPFFIELKFLVFNDMARIFARGCLLPPETVVPITCFVREDLNELPSETSKYFLSCLLEEDIEEDDSIRESVLYGSWVKEFFDALKKWRVPFPSFELVPRNSIKIVENPWFRHFSPLLQNFLSMKEIDGFKNMIQRIFSRKLEVNYMYQQNMLYDDAFYRELTPKGWKFLTYFEDLLAEKILKFDKFSIDSLASEISDDFTESLRDLKLFLHIIDDSAKIVTINDFIEVRFIEGKSIIHVHGHEFIQCKYILLINPHQDEHHHQINSIDEAQRFLDSDLEPGKLTPSALGISPEDEFWAHCSNLQAWVENNYDTRLLHSNLSFPLLKALAGRDLVARMRLQEEIVSRISARYFPVIQYLMKEKYFTYLTKDQLGLLLEVLQEIYLEQMCGCSSSSGAVKLLRFMEIIRNYMKRAII